MKDGRLLTAASMIYGKKIAVDFDGTLHFGHYPEIGEPNITLIETLKTLKTQNQCELILYTSRTDTELQKAVCWCEANGLQFDSVFGGKPFAHIYIDDRAVNPTPITRIRSSCVPGYWRNKD